MMIDAKKTDKQALREMKVKIPVHQHIRLHALKIRDGQQISETVERALADYFDRYLARRYE